MTRDRFPVVVHLLLLRQAAQEDEIFLLRRAGTGFMDGYHVLPGGHVQAGETLEETAVRECREETGVVPGKLEPVCVLPYRSGRHQGINMIFRGRCLSGTPGLAEPDHSDECGWYPLRRMPEPRAPWIADVLELRERGEWFRELRYG